MLDKEHNKKIEIFSQEHIMQLYRALNRQYDKYKAVKIVVDFIYKKLGYEALYIDAIEDGNMLMAKYISSQSLSIPIKDKEELFCSIYKFAAPSEEYRNRILLEDEDSIMSFFPNLYRIIQPQILLSTPVFSQNKLVGLLVIYDRQQDQISGEVKYVTKLIAKELTAVFSRIERQNLDFENMLGLTALESILLYNPEESVIAANDPVQKIVSIIPRTIGIKKCTIALLDEKKEYLLPHYSNFDRSTEIKEKKYSLDKSKTKDHTAIIAMETKKPVVVFDALTDPRCDHELSKALGIYSNITLPILNVQGGPLGVMYLDNGEYESFSKRQIRFFEIVARHIGLIISNIEYIGDLKIWSKYDGLTGLLNRRTFDNVYEEIYNIYRFSEEKFSILMIDIDDFKSTNDNHGHQMGDEILRRVAKSIRENVREKDISGRYGGEEIIIILKDICKEEAIIIADRIRYSISNVSVEGVSVTASIGISTFGVDSYNKESLIAIADRCLLNAKGMGKNQVICN